MCVWKKAVNLVDSDTAVQMFKRVSVTWLYETVFFIYYKKLTLAVDQQIIAQ